MQLHIKLVLVLCYGGRGCDNALGWKGGTTPKRIGDSWWRVSGNNAPACEAIPELEYLSARAPGERITLLGNRSCSALADDEQTGIELATHNERSDLCHNAQRRARMMSGTSTGRKELIYERRETSLVGSGNGLQRRDMVDKAVQYRDTMNQGSGDTSDYFIDIQTNSDTYSSEIRFDTYDYQPTITKTHVTENSSIPPPTIQPPTPTTAKFTSNSSESLNKWAVHEEFDDEPKFFKGKENKTEPKSATLAVVEDNKQPSFTANESNPTVPSAAEPSKTSTLRLSDRARSESEDDIEKMDDPEQDGPIIGHKTLHKTMAATEDSPNSEKIDKNGNRSDYEQNEADNDCIVQCLYYTIQCCECVIF